MTSAILLVFITGYLLITLEHIIKINKVAFALVTGVVCWTIYILSPSGKENVLHQLAEHLGDISGILFFLLGAMTIVELIDAHNGFDLVTEKIYATDKKKLIWIISFISFFLSAVLDNLTTTIVMVSLIKKIIADKNDRLFFAGMIVIAANAGGAWSPIGDVTTTMLWIGGQITAGSIMAKLLIPSLVCLFTPLLVMHFSLKGKITKPAQSTTKLTSTKARERNIIFFLGLVLLIAVPVFKTMTHLPPFMGMLLSLGIMWIVTEIIHSGKSSEDKDFLSVVYALRKIDTPSILFFLGILLSVAALQSTGQLLQASAWLSNTLKNESLISITIGLFSAVVDNVPIVAAVQAMYPLEHYPTNHYLWEFLAYTTGTGGSVLIIGSAAGVAAMGIEKINFFWYIKKISLWALIGYFAGAAVYIIQNAFLS
ncbi:MAG TPA: sodium:proton antiporter NhaD [Chitinophagaceae bacterium]|nr:sodium:proton antiporter NhaD [Chitinophagaceae bacterium]